MLAGTHASSNALPRLGGLPPWAPPPRVANNFDVKWVMSQVGHADSKMTLDVYAQLEQRIDRHHGKAFDAVIRDAH